LLTAGKELFELVNTYDANISAIILDIILKNGIITKEGLESSLKEIENLDAVKNSTQGL